MPRTLFLPLFWDVVYLSGEKRYVAFKERVAEREACGWLLWVEMFVVHYEEACIRPKERSCQYQTKTRFYISMLSWSLTLSFSVLYFLLSPLLYNIQNGKFRNRNQLITSPCIICVKSRPVFNHRSKIEGKKKKRERGGHVGEDRYSVLPWRNEGYIFTRWAGEEQERSYIGTENILCTLMFWINNIWK